jgi:hypothetical protein
MLSICHCLFMCLLCVSDDLLLSIYHCVFICIPFVCSDGVLFMWGCGDNGRLGLGSLESQSVPARVALPDDEAVVDVSCGSQHTAIVTGMFRHV